MEAKHLLACPDHHLQMLVSYTVLLLLEEGEQSG
jgi:hypothetical protein